MDQLSTAAFELRASAAEARLAALEARLGGSASTSAASPEELTQLRDTLVAAKEQAQKVQQERDEACERQKALENENSRLRYQIVHLKRAVQEGDEKQTAVKA